MRELRREKAQEVIESNKKDEMKYNQMSSKSTAGKIIE